MKKYSVKNVIAFLGELRRRKVYRVIAAYAVVSWLALQIGEVTFGPLGLPDWSMTALIIVVIAGFPVAMALSWLFELTPSGIRLEAEGSAGDAEKPTGQPSIAVLPFADMSSEQDQHYFCEGIAEEILNALTRIDELRVAARASSFQYPDVGLDVRRVGKDLGVATVLEGSVRKAGDRLRITAQLVDVADGYHLWSRSFDENLEDIFAIQDVIAQSIAQLLLETIGKEQRSPIKTASSQDVTAYECYLRGRHFMHRFRKTHIEFARQMFHQAIERDAEFALAWAGYADCHSLLYMYADPRELYRTEAARASNRAVELAPDLAEAHASRGLACLVADDYAAARQAFERALELNPQLYEGYYYCGRALFHQGDLEQAAEFFRKAAEVNPAEYQARCLRVQILRAIGDHAEAVREARKNVEVLDAHLRWNPDDVRALHLGAGSLITAGETERAKRWLARALEIDPDDSILLYNVACNYATIGETDTALDYLEAAVDNGMVSYAWVSNDTDFDSVRSHPRFQRLLERIENLERLSAGAVDGQTASE
jgi:adenylate cyclase